MSTATTAPARSSVNQFVAIQHAIVYHATAPEMLVTVQVRDSANREMGTMTLRLTQTSAQKIIYGADGAPIVATDNAMTGRAVGAFTAFNGASGSAIARGAAMDTYLQTNGVYPA